MLTGEHGVGVEKRDLMTEMFTAADLEQQHRVKCAFDGAGPVQSRQGVSHSVGLRRAGPYACAWRPAAASPSAALLMEQGRPAKPRSWSSCARRATREAPFEIVAGGTRRSVGKPIGDDLPVLDVSGLSGIVKYEPEELIVTAAPGTPLTEIDAVLAEKASAWALIRPTGRGCWAPTASPRWAARSRPTPAGSGRLRHGAARDSLLGFRGVNGLGESFRGGAKVVKNVTGFDLPKLVCGAYGHAVRADRTDLPRLSQAAAVRDPLADVTPGGFAACARSRFALEPPGWPICRWQATGLVFSKDAALIRLEGASEPLEEKCAWRTACSANMRSRRSRRRCSFPAIGNGENLRRPAGRCLAGDGAAGRAPRRGRRTECPALAGRLGRRIDLAGGAPGSDAVAPSRQARRTGDAAARRAKRRANALASSRRRPPALAELTRAVKAAFDPLSLFNPGRMWDGV